METKQRDLSNESYERGYNAESVIVRLLRDEGYYVAVDADINERGRGGAPGARTRHGFITLPDLDVARSGHRAFVEVKYKYEATFTIKTGREEHGWGLRKYKMYKQAQTQFGTEVYICVYEGKTGAILMATIDELAPLARYYTGNKMDRGGMVFFPRASFGLWGHIGTVDGQIPLDMPPSNGNGVESGKLFKVTRSKKPAIKTPSQPLLL